MKVILIHPLRHDGKAYAEGDVIDIAKADAEALIACGTAESVDVASKKAASKAETEAKAKADAEAEAEAKAKADAEAGK